MAQPSLEPFPAHVIIASRESALALWQARHIQSLLITRHPGMRVDILGMTTSGDRHLDTSLSKIGGKGLFVKELEQALLDGRADIAVHSVKDVPMNLEAEFALAVITEREDPRDAFVSNRFDNLAALPPGSVVGTSSLRRQSQLQAAFPELRFESLRGNLQTRLSKLEAGQYDAIVLAAAGLKRLGLEAHIRDLLPIELSLPAVGQGALGIEILAAREDLLPVLAPLQDDLTRACVDAERAFSRALGGSCQVPIAGHAVVENGQLVLRGLVATPDGTQVLSARSQGGVADAEPIGMQLAQELMARGAAAILAQCQT